MIYWHSAIVEPSARSRCRRGGGGCSIFREDDRSRALAAARRPGGRPAADLPSERSQMRPAARGGPPSYRSKKIARSAISNLHCCQSSRSPFSRGVKVSAFLVLAVRVRTSEATTAGRGSNRRVAVHAAAVPGEPVAARGMDGLHQRSGLPLPIALPARRNTEPSTLARPPPGLGGLSVGGRFQRRESDMYLGFCPGA